ncbi:MULTISPECIES: J domain-containing protein [Stappia]|uniref:DnaJ family molecular chaperone n=1 Tax=Stappia taiwanensis TaxID=992267 RepID=A0A838XVX1_9HYPH|nr:MULTISPECIES: DnaJ family molecular chaperone [Stappia]MBA4611103.1 DnaJ family molecular chaperone [Stappia taiwanensis]MCA1298975.1 DnaJ family molecular chaperone [Stappia indica]GGE85931.1 molecular chaperone DjlA [Stappia taiwanensis]
MTIWDRISAVVSAIGAGGVQVVDRLVQFIVNAGDGRTGDRSVAFTVAMIALSAKMAKADGVVTGDEEIAFLDVFDIPAGEERNVARLFNLAKQDVAGFETYAQRLAALFPDDPETRVDILDVLFHIAKADGVVHEHELAYLRRVGEIFGLDARAFNQLLARHTRGGGDPYRVLGLDETVPTEELRRHYRRLVGETHPDRLIARGVPEEFVKIANDRLAALNAAYAQIAAERRL